MSYSPLLFPVDDIWLLPLFGCLSLCVHPAAPQSDSGPFTTFHVALLWPQVIEWNGIKPKKPNDLLSLLGSRKGCICCIAAVLNSAIVKTSLNFR